MRATKAIIESWLRFHRTLLCITAIGLACWHPTTTLAADQEGAAAQFHRVLADFEAWWVQEYPEIAASRGDRSKDADSSEVGMPAITRRYEWRQRCLARLDGIPEDQLAAGDRLDRQLLRGMLQDEQQQYTFGMHFLALTPIGGIHVQIPWIARSMRVTDLKSLEDYLSRLETYPARIEEIIALLRAGLAAGMTLPQSVLSPVPEQIDKVITKDLERLAEPFGVMWNRIPRSEANRLWARYHQRTLPGLRSALTRLRAFVADEYLPGCRRAIAISEAPRGPELYRFLLRRITSTDLTPEEIHELGKREVSRIRQEIIRAARATDYVERFPRKAQDDDDRFLAEFLTYLRTDRRFYYEREEDLLAGYRDICKRIDPYLPMFFRSLPRLTFGVMGNPLASAGADAFARYLQGDVEAGVASQFMVNTVRLSSHPKFMMIPTALHEAVPGHHLQLALAAESTSIPFFRRGSFNLAFVEGWGLYAEGLGEEMGLYTDPYDRIGRLLFESLRACRMVVDPGINAFAWTREQAQEYLAANTCLDRGGTDVEIDRYIVMPSQATSYKIGELRIRELRSKAQQALGNSFNVRDFHEVVLGAGAVPLSMLEQRVSEWIESRVNAE